MHACRIYICQHAFDLMIQQSLTGGYLDAQHRSLASLQALQDAQDASRAVAGLDDAMKAALDFAAQWNSCQLVIAGCSRLVKAWRATLAVCTPLGRHIESVLSTWCVKCLKFASTCACQWLPSSACCL